jgi:hypothetical protein
MTRSSRTRSGKKTKTWAELGIELRIVNFMFLLRQILIELTPGPLTIVANAPKARIIPLNHSAATTSDLCDLQACLKALFLIHKIYPLIVARLPVPRLNLPVEFRGAGCGEISLHQNLLTGAKSSTTDIVWTSRLQQDVEFECERQGVAKEEGAG